MSPLRPALALSVAVSLAGCATQAPVSTLVTGEAFSSATTAGAEAGAQANGAVPADWWRKYGDSDLDALIAQALTSNHDIRIALARVSQARAGLDAATSRLLPSLSLTAAQSDQRSGLPDAFKQRGSPDLTATRLGGELNWELDLFGAARASRRAFAQDALASESAAHGARLLVSSEVARQWFLRKSAQRQIILLDALIASLTQQVTLVQQRVQAGLSSALDLDQVEAELSALQAERPALDALHTALNARLAVLTGQSPLVAAPALPSAQALPWPAIAALSPGQPLDLLARRPDLVAAEQQLAAEGERLLEARRNFLPRVFLNVVGGVQNLVINGLTQNGIGFTQAAAAFSLPVFNGGRLNALAAVQSARQQQALLQYEKSVLTALEEVEGSLAVHAGQRITLQARDRSLTARQASLAKGEQLRRRGQIDQIQLEGLKRLALLAEQQQLAARLQTVLADIQLHKALGGGWQAAPEARPLPTLIQAAGDTP